MRMGLPSLYVIHIYFWCSFFSALLIKCINHFLSLPVDFVMVVLPPPPLSAPALGSVTITRCPTLERYIFIVLVIISAHLTEYCYQIFDFKHSVIPVYKDLYREQTLKHFPPLLHGEKIK